MKKNYLLLIFLCLLTFSLKAQYTASSPISLSQKSNVVIEGKSFTAGTNGASIVLTDCSNIKIRNCNFKLTSGIIGVQLKNCTNVEINGNHFENFSSGVYAVSCKGGINVHCNSFKNIAGTRPRGQIVQFNGCSGAGNRVNYNTLDHTMGAGNPEDLINMYATSGTIVDPIQIIGNNLRGGGPSTTGGGIMVGDNGGHDIIVSDNNLVDPGQYGIGVPAGYNITVKNNKIYAKQQSFTNVGLYVGLSGEIAAGFPCSGSTIRIEGNQVNWTSKTGGKNGWYNCSCCPGVVLVNNNFNAPITSSILPASLSLNSISCGIAVPVNSLPAIAISGPANATVFNAPASIVITANATDADGTISKVEFYNGTVLLGSDLTSPYSYTWSNVAAGSYTIYAKATDNSGGVSTSAGVALSVKTVITVNTPPTVSLTSPANSSSYTAPAAVTITANAADANGTISKVEFYNGSTLLGTDMSSPYSYSWTAIAAGNYVITAKAYDNLNAVTTSVASAITVTSVPVSSVNGINGPSCITAGQTYTYTVVPESNPTTISFWSNSAAVIIQDATDKKKMTIQVPSHMTGTSFTLYSGVNYSVSPWYKEYTKVVKVGGCSAKINVSVVPQPAETSSTIQLENNQKIIFVVVYNDQGQEVFRSGKMETETYELGSELAQGLYNVFIHSEEGTTHTRFMKK